MSRTSKLRILSYDISENRRRRRVARLLEEEASRVQYSVFEGRLTQRSLERLVRKIEAELGKSDSLRVYTVGRTGERGCDLVGSGVPIDREAAFWLL